MTRTSWLLFHASGVRGMVSSWSDAAGTNVGPLRIAPGTGRATNLRASRVKGTRKAYMYVNESRWCIDCGLPSLSRSSSGLHGLFLSGRTPPRSSQSSFFFFFPAFIFMKRCRQNTKPSRAICASRLPAPSLLKWDAVQSPLLLLLGPLLRLLLGLCHALKQLQPLLVHLVELLAPLRNIAAAFVNLILQPRQWCERKCTKGQIW